MKHRGEQCNKEQGHKLQSRLESRAAREQSESEGANERVESPSHDKTQRLKYTSARSLADPESAAILHQTSSAAITATQAMRPPTRD